MPYSMKTQYPQDIAGNTESVSANWSNIGSVAFSWSCMNMPPTLNQ